MIHNLSKKRIRGQAVLFLGFFFFTCCGSSVNQINKHEKKERSKPHWLQGSDVQSGYYVGIGHSFKDNSLNYIQQAKNSALEAIASDIRVTLQSSSVLTQWETDKVLQEKYMQVIQSTVADELEEYEQVDAWEDDRNYWVYYRLSKLRYKQIKEEKKKKAVTLALDFFDKARKSDENHDLSSALNYYYQSFKAVEKYLNEPIRLIYDDREILLVNEIINSVQQLVNEIDIHVSPSEIKVDRLLPKEGLTIQATVTSKKTKKPVSKISLKTLFDKGKGDLLSDYHTDENGQARLLLTRIDSPAKEQVISIHMDLVPKMAQESAIYTHLIRKIITPKGYVKLIVIPAKVYVDASEKQNNIVVNRLSKLLTTSGFVISTTPDQTDLVFKISSSWGTSNQSGNITVSYVTVRLRVIRQLDNEEIFFTTIDQVKGYGAQVEHSNQNAATRAADILEHEKWNDIIKLIVD